MSSAHGGMLCVLYRCTLWDAWRLQCIGCRIARRGCGRVWHRPPLHNVQEVSASGLLWRFCNSPNEAGQDPHVQRLEIRAAVREVQELEGCIRLPRLEALFQRRAEYSFWDLLEQGWRRSGRHVSHARQAGYMHKESVRRLSC